MITRLSARRRSWRQTLSSPVLRTHSRSLVSCVLGTTLLGDTYNVANTMPNILYNLIIGGALTAAFVPQMVRAIREPMVDQHSSLDLLRLHARSWSLVLVSIVAAPLLVHLFASSYSGRRDLISTLSSCATAYLKYSLWDSLHYSGK